MHRSRDKLNLHLYEAHSEADVMAKYNKTLDQVLGKRSKDRIRAVAYT
jgi:hypothetical protein